MNKKKLFLQAFQDTIPIMTGYLFLGAGFGIILQSKGYGWPWALLLSSTLFCGTMQYVGVDLLFNSVSLLTTGLTTLMVNARHLFYGISLIDRYKDAGILKPYMIFGLTDETYSLVSRETLPNNRDTIIYCFFVTLLDHIYWITGGLLGVLAGSLLKFNWEGVDFVLTALFVTIVVDQWLNSAKHADALIGFASAGICLIIFGADTFLIPTMICILGLLTLARPHLEEKPDEKPIQENPA